MDRRSLLKTAVWGVAALVIRPVRAHPDAEPAAQAQLAELEHRHGGRLGVAILDVAGTRRVGYRADERFLMCSTHKVLTVGAVLARVDAGREQLDRRMIFGRDALLAWAPVTSKHVGAPGLSVGELCAAAITVSDNTADNLLLTSLGGPHAVTAFARKLGDRLTRLDRFEPELNQGAPGDLRDTTTPNAMLGSLHALLLGDALSAASRAQLATWLRAASTGRGRLRAGVPHDWIAGDKTGTGPHGESGDVAILWPPHRKPLLVAAYYVNPDLGADSPDPVFAAVGRIAAAW
ncbi:MAG: class A beta-lactamase [Rhodanobacter sp.]|nr:MAG: class A beta-lactamase [Rhodanobacter sp.]TAM13616.1 MAG: class A beta-lactamase [Rhodanobacter sp.]TAM35631.1 MAG: class A beta-lactamase [Rhodanobacter sp.]